MLQRIGMIAFAVAVLAPAAPPPEAPPPKLVGIYQSPFDAELPPVPSGFLRTISVAFSPDEKWIALVMGARSATGRLPSSHLASTLLLLPLYTSQIPRVQISPGMPAGDPHWSPDSGSLAVWAIPAAQMDPTGGTGITKLFDLNGKLLWTGPPTGPIAGFIAPGRLLARHANRMGKLSGFDTIDVRTSAVTAWPASRAASRHWRVAAMDPDRQLVAVVTEDWSKTLIVDYSTGKVLKSRKNSMASGSSPGYFAEHGKTLCSAASPQGEFSDHPTCRDVDTGKTIAELKGVPGGRPADASAAGSRMVVTKLNYFPSQQGMTYSGTVVWDFRSGAEIAAWAASDLQVGPFSPDLPLGGGWDVLSSAVAISSSGRYVALQLGEDVQIYELP